MLKLNGLGVAFAAFVAMVGSGSAAADPYAFGDAYVVDHDGAAAEADLALGLRLGIGLSLADSGSTRTALELAGSGNRISRSASTEDSQQFGAMLDLVNTFKREGLSPFIFAGVGAMKEDLAASSGVYPAIEAGLGVEHPGDGGVLLRASFSAQAVFNDEANAAEDTYVDYRLMLGLAGLGAPVPPPPARPADGDGDGLPDSQDRCPAQPAATADGCPAPLAPAAPPRDTDGDGIDDAQDECPGTLEGLNVDASGCVAAESAQKVVLKGVNFLPGSIELTPDAKAVLNEAYEALAGQANLKVEVGGHTDSMGDEKLNQSLSQRRAESVKKYLADKGIAADRLTAKGYGESQPIADNKTRAGRQQNRRVELKILN